MTELSFLQEFQRYGAETVLVSFFVVFCVWLLKKTLLKNHLQHLIVTFLPFILGMVVAVAVQCVLNFSWAYVTENFAVILQSGFTAGCLSTVESAVISRLFGKKALSKRACVIRELLTSFAAEEALDQLSVQIANGVSAKYSEEDVACVTEILKEYAGEGQEECELRMLALLIIETLKTMAV